MDKDYTQLFIFATAVIVAIGIMWQLSVITEHVIEIAHCATGEAICNG